MAVALTRGVPASISRCEVTHIARTPIDVDVLRRQHAAYEAALKDAGFRVVQIPADEAHPDCMFIEDALVVIGSTAIITRPGAESRRGETAAVAAAAREALPHLNFREIVAPDTLDGGDVLVVGRRVFVGLSTRTTAGAVAQLAEAVAHEGFGVESVAVDGCLHLKSAVTCVDPTTVILVGARLSPAVFARHSIRVIATPPSEQAAANVVAVPPSVAGGDGVVLVPAGSPATAGRLRATTKAKVVEVEMGEAAKAEGALTCCSVRVCPM